MERRSPRKWPNRRRVGRPEELPILHFGQPALASQQRQHPRGRRHSTV
jgi:hypothetical protein